MGKQIIVLCIFMASSLWAKQVSISLDRDDHAKPYADDLVYQGERIDRIEALELKKKGFDLSTLNPYESHLWKNESLASQNYDETDLPSVEDELVFENFKASPTEIFRAYVYHKQNPLKRYLIIGSLDNHTNIIRAALLRNLGYRIPTPKYLPQVKIEFRNAQQMKTFIETVGEQTLTKREKWVVEQKEKSAIFRGFIIEPAKLENVNIYLPVMSRESQRDRRVFRALLDIYTLTDFPQDINKIGWSLGTIFNNRLVLGHPYAHQFQEVTLEDLQWIHRKLASLSAAQIWDAVELSGYPEDIKQLVYQKLLARINHLTAVFGLRGVKHFPVNKRLSVGNIRNGELTSGEYPNHVVEFYNKDPLSPYRFSEIFRLFSNQVLYSALSGGLDLAIEKFVPGLNVNDATADIQEQITAYQQGNGQSSLPTKLWTSPIANGRIYGARNIVFGQYLGSNAPIQLVDSVGAEINLGMYGSLTGLSQTIRPVIAANAKASRTYVHVRAMPDLKTATKTHVKKLLIPRLMKTLGHMIDDHIKCDLPEKVWVEEETLSGNPIHYVKYDQEDESAKEAAIKRRQELIDSGIPTSQVLLMKVDRTKICTEQVVDKRNKNLEKFLKEFAEGESFIINDSIKIGVDASTSIPLGTIGLPNNSSLSFGGDASTLLLRGITIKRTSVGFEITVQQQKDAMAGLDMGLNYFIELFNVSSKWTRGKMIARVFKVKVDGVSDEQKQKAMTALRHLFVYNNQGELRNHFQPYLLDHNVRLRLDSFRALFFRADNQLFNHQVDITIPKSEDDPTDLVRTRTLYSSTVHKREGNDYFSFADRVLRSFVPVVGLGFSSAGDPGKTFYGNSYKRTYITESEITPNYPMKTMSRVETTYSGWSINNQKLYQKFDTIEAMFYPYTDRDTIEKSIIHGSPKLMSYDVRNTILLYPKALDRIKSDLFRKSESQVISKLRLFYGREKWDNYCQHAERFFGEHNPQAYFGDRDYDCVPPSIQTILFLRRKGVPTDKRKYTQFITKVVAELFEYYKRDELLYWLGEDSFFATTKVTGFRINHVNGFLDYLSDSVGKYDNDAGTGIYAEIATVLGISLFELKALNYTPGF